MNDLRADLAALPDRVAAINDSIETSVAMLNTAVDDLVKRVIVNQLRKQPQTTEDLCQTIDRDAAGSIVNALRELSEAGVVEDDPAGLWHVTDRGYAADRSGARQQQQPQVEVFHTLGRWTNIANALGLAPLNAVCGVNLYEEAEVERCPACVAKLERRRWWRR